MYANRELFESQGTFMEIDFGDGSEETDLSTNVDTTVILEPQVSQAQTFIEINFDDVDFEDNNNTPSIVGPEPLPAKFITIDFDAIEETEINSPQQGAFIEIDFDEAETAQNTKINTSNNQAETPMFIEIDFGEGITKEESNAVTSNNQIEAPTFIELDFGDGEIETNTKEATKVTISASRAQESNGQRPNNTVLFFVPGTKKGILIYNQSPTGPEAKKTGYLPEGTFHASGMEPVEFDPNKHSEEFDYIRTPNGSYVQQVIMVDEKTLMKIVLQGIYQRTPDAEHRRHYFIVNIHDKERNLRKEFIKATYEEEELPPKQQALFNIIREIGRTVQGKTTIGDIITG